MSRAAMKVEELAAELSGLEMRIGSQLMAKGLTVYEATKRAAKKNAALQDRADQLGQRFARTKTAKAGTAGKPATARSVE